MTSLWWDKVIPNICICHFMENWFHVTYDTQILQSQYKTDNSCKFCYLKLHASELMLGKHDNEWLCTTPAEGTCDIYQLCRNIHTKTNHACIPEKKDAKEQTSDWHITTKDKPGKCMVNQMVFKLLLQPNGIQRYASKA